MLALPAALGVEDTAAWQWRRKYWAKRAALKLCGSPRLLSKASRVRSGICWRGSRNAGRLKDTFGDKVNAVQVEVYQLPYEGKPVPAMQEWGLQSEPWLFLVEEDGKIVGRYEGGITFQELEPAMAQLMQ